MQDVQFGEKKSTRKLSVGLKACAGRDKEIKADLKWNKGKVPLKAKASWQSFHLVKGTGPRKFLQQKTKAATNVIQGGSASCQW